MRFFGSLLFSASLGLPLAQAEQVLPGEALLEFVEYYCADCHGGGVEKGGLDLEALLDQPMAAHSDIWERAILRLDTRQMPPPDEERPKEEEYRAMIEFLAGPFDREARRNPQVVRGETLRRLTRTEYRNAIRDLLALEIEVDELLPKDDASHGFDNVTVSNLSPTLLNRYLSAAQKVSRLAVGIAPKAPEGRVFRLPPDLTQEEHVPGLPLGTRGGVLLPHNFPTAGTYEIELRLTRDRDEKVEGLTAKHEVEVLLDGERVSLMTVSPPPRGSRDFSDVDAQLRCRVQVGAGAADLGVTFLAKAPTLDEGKREPYEASFNMHRHPRRSPALYQISITGPYELAEGEESASRELLFAGREGRTAADAREILRPILRRAYRREVSEEDMERPMAFFAEGSEESFEAGLEAALSAVLVSPRFLFRVEEDPAGLPSGTVYPLDDFALASRLSFFLWSSLPDERLLDLAAAGELHKPEVLTAETRRMLSDDRAHSLVTSFADQWLHLRNLDSVQPDLRLFPDFDDNLRQAFRTETEMLFATVLREDRGVGELLSADYTFLNERLAAHYGIPGIYGSRFRKVALQPEWNRGGLLRQGSFLAVTSYANRTSPVIRGNWVLETILGTPTPPPPPDIPSLDDNVVAASLPMRERLAAHSAQPSCATCHDLMDPIGFSLENYDATGRFRLFEDAAAIDSRGGLPDGREFDGAGPLIEGFLERPDLFARALTEKLLTYALGRGTEASDQPAIRTIIRDAAARDYQLSDLVLGIVLSDSFTKSQTR